MNAPGRVQQGIRTALILIGALGTAYGIYLLLSTTRPTSALGLATWMLGAIILHDAILSPLVFSGGLLLRKLGRGRAWATLGILQVAVVLGAMLSLLALPAIVAKSRGARNPTVLPLDYTGNLLLSLGVLAGLTLLALVAVSLYARSRKLTQVPVVRQAEGHAHGQQRGEVEAEPQLALRVFAVLTTAALVLNRLIRAFRR